MYTVPDDDATCGWNEALETPPEARRWVGDERADCVVVGAGYTGLATARRLAELRPEWRIVVLEAQRVGSGASGRNSGFVVDLVEATVRLDRPRQAGYIRLARAGIEQLRELTRDGKIDCDWDESGWIRAAAGQRGRRALEGMRPHLDNHDVPYEILDADALAATTGSAFYRYGMRFPGSPQVQPAALVRGLADQLPASVELYEESPVVDIDRQSPIRVTTTGGSVVADRVFLGTNGYTPALGFLQRRIFPLYAFGSFSRVLSQAEQERLGGEREWGILGLDPMGSTVRRTRDQRLFIRNSLFYTKKFRVGEVELERARANHRKGFLSRFPELGEIELNLTWSGLLGNYLQLPDPFRRAAPQCLRHRWLYRGRDLDGH
nr:gamma-glutamylputrescine oxidoreductase-like [Nerophis lumbriciformis]